MEDPQLFKVLATIGFILALVLIALLSTEPWRKHWFGVSVMALTIGVGLLEFAAVLRQWLGPHYDWRNLIRALGQFFVVISLAERVIELVVVKIQRRRARRSRHTPTT